MKKDVSKKLAIIAFLLMLVGAVLSPLIDGGSYDLNPLSSMAFMMLFAVVFIYAKSESFVRFGFGLIAIIAFAQLGSLLALPSLNLSSITKVLDLVVLILLILSSVYYFTRLCLVHFGYTKDINEQPTNKMAQLKKWKKLADQQIISADDYNSVKLFVLADANQNKLPSLAQLLVLIESELANVSDLHAFLK